MSVKFRKKPVVIEAVRYNGFNAQEVFRFMGKPSSAALLEVGGALVIETLEGNMEASPGDWIIKGVKGEFYPCKPDIFDATYEAARDEDAALLRAARSDRAVLDEVNDKVDILLKMARLV